MRRLAALVLVTVVALTGCASGGLGDLKDRVVKFERADVERGRAIAAAANDQAAVGCADAVLKTLPEASVAPALTPIGVFSAVMKAREVRRKVSAGIDEGVHNACAVVILDAQQTIMKLGLMAVPGGGALRMLGPR